MIESHHVRFNSLVEGSSCPLANLYDSKTGPGFDVVIVKCLHAWKLVFLEVGQESEHSKGYVAVFEERECMLIGAQAH